MERLSHRIAQALVAFRKAEGFTLTTDQYEALIDQMALAVQDLGIGQLDFNYDAFVGKCHNKYL